MERLCPVSPGLGIGKALENLEETFQRESQHSATIIETQRNPCIDTLYLKIFLKELLIVSRFHTLDP